MSLLLSQIGEPPAAPALRLRSLMGVGLQIALVAGLVALL
jgi:hypothetical protein